MNFANHSSAFQPCSSVGSLSMVSLSQIRDQQNLDYLQNLCAFIDQMNLNPIWYRQETPTNRLKVLEIYQTAINYSKNLSQAYHQQIQALERKNSQMRQDNEEKETKIRIHKERVQKLRQKYKIKKHKLYKNIYTNLKRKIDQEQHQRHHNRDKDYSRSSIDRPEVVYYPMQPPNQYYPFRQPDPHHHPGAQYHYQPQTPPPPDPRFPYEHQPSPVVDPQAALAQGLLNFINGKPNSQEKEEENRRNKQGGLIGTNKTNNSFLRKENEQNKNNQLYEEGQSEIIAKHLSSKDQPKANTKSIAKGSQERRRPSIENSNHMDLPNLGQYSKKSSAASHKNVEDVHSNSQKEQQQFDSIANINIKNQSNVQKRGPFQSKIFQKEQALKPSQEYQPIKEQNDELGFTLPGESKRLGKSQKKPIDLKSPANSSGLNIPKQHEVGVTNLKTSNFSRNRPEEVVERLFPHAPPTRASRQSKIQQNQKTEETKLQKSKEENFDDLQLIAQSNAGARLKVIQDFGDIQNSTIRKGEKQKPKSPIVNSIEQQKNSKSSHSTPKRQDIEVKTQKQRSEDYGDIYSSNIGNKSSESKSNQVQKVHSGPPVRSSKQGPIIDQNNLTYEISKPPIPKAKEENHQQEQPEKNAYEEDFEQEFDMEDLQISKRPASKKESSGPEPEQKQSQQTKNRLSNKKPTIRMEPSRVNIDVSSLQSITEKSKYYRLKNDQFKLKLKDNIFGKTEKSQSLGPDIEDTFDFLDTIPANSVIAKRPLLNSQIAKTKRHQEKNPSVSIKNFPSSEDLGGSSGGNISIHLITHDNKNQTILSRNDYEKVKDTIQQIDENEESSLIKKKSGESNLPITKDVLASKPPRNELTESSLPVEQGVLNSKIQSGQERSSLIELNNLSNKQRKPSESSLRGDKPRKGSEQINIEIEEDYNLKDDQSASSSLRNKILVMIRQFDKTSLPKAEKSEFPETRLKEILNAKCKFDQNGSYSIEKIKMKQVALENEIKTVRTETENRKRRVDDYFRQGIQLQTPPKLSDPKDNDSLLYSASYFDYSRNGRNNSNKEIKAKEVSADDNRINNLQIENPNSNPYTPGFESDKNKPRQSPKAANKFLLENAKSVGGKEKEQLFKNAGEGILKFDKDDPLNREVVDLLKKKNNTEQEQYEDDDQWGE